MFIPSRVTSFGKDLGWLGRSEGIAGGGENEDESEMSAEKMGRPGTGDEEELTIEPRYFQAGLAQEPGKTCRCPMRVADVDLPSSLGMAR